MEKLLVYLSIGVISLVIFRILLYWIMQKVTSMKPKKKKLSAEELIMRGRIKSVPERPRVVEEQYRLLREYFRLLLQEKKLTRKDLLTIKEYIKENIGYENKNYRNEAHFIYSALKYSKDLKLSHILEIVNYLETKEE